MLKPTPKERVLFVRRLTLALLVLIGVFSLVITNFIRSPEVVDAAAANTINFQARLQTAAGAIVPDGTYNVEFKLYDASTSSGASQGSCSGDAHCLWTETRTSGNKVQVINGYLSVNLGSVTAFGNINWDQQHWMTMNIGGTGSATWDGEMNPRLSLTAVPYAFSASQLNNTDTGGRSGLTFQGSGSGHGDQNFVLQDQGAAGTYNILTAPSGSDGYLKLQGSTPGTQQTGSFNISGTGIAGTLQASDFDRASSGTLTFGNTNATTINIGTNNSAHTIAIGTGTGGQTVTIGSTVGASTTTIQGGDGGIIFSQGTSTTGGYAFKANGGQTILTMDYYGRTTFKALGSSIGNIFEIQNSSGTSLVSVSSNDNVTYIQGGGLKVGSGGIATDGALAFSGISNINYTTPLGANISTKINIPNYDPGAYNQIIALGLPGSAASTARAITLADARSSAHQPTIAVLSPDENQIGGFSWEGSSSVFQTKTTSASIALGNSGGAGLTLTAAGSGQTVAVGSAGSKDGAVQLNNSTNSNTATIQATGTSTSYVTNLPAAIGSANQCLAVASVASSTQQLGYADCLTSSNGVQLQASTPGTQQTGNLNISGTGIFGTAVNTAQLSASSGITIGSTAGTGNLTNNGSTVNTTLALNDFSSGGSIGSAASTVDIYTSISVNQLTGSQTLTIPTPTASTTYGRQIYLSNIGNQSFTLLGTLLKPGATASLIWANTNGGASWQYAGSDGNGILNQNGTTQTADFSINGTGKAGTFQAGTFSSTSSVTLQAASGSDININPGANGAGSGILNLAVNAATLNIGNGSNNARTIAIGNTAGSQAQTITIGNNSGTTSTTTIQGSGGVTLQANGSTVGVTVKSATNSSVAFQVQNSSNVGFFTVDTSTSTITLGNSASGNYITFTASGGLTAYGTSQHSKSIVFSPEYTSAVFDAASDSACSSANNGSLTSLYDATNYRNYYNWTSTQASNQCYDIIVDVVLPNDFSSWASSDPINLQALASNTSNAGYAIAIRNVTGAAWDSNYGSGYASPGTISTSWSDVASSSFSGTYAAGDRLSIKVRMTAKSSANLQLGNLTLNYNSKW